MKKLALFLILIFTCAFFSLKTTEEDSLPVMSTGAEEFNFYLKFNDLTTKNLDVRLKNCNIKEVYFNENLYFVYSNTPDLINDYKDYLKETKSNEDIELIQMNGEKIYMVKISTTENSIKYLKEKFNVVEIKKETY